MARTMLLGTLLVGVTALGFSGAAAADHPHEEDPCNGVLDDHCTYWDGAKGYQECRSWALVVCVYGE